MKKIILSVCIGYLLVFGCCSCGVDVDKGYGTYYTYINHTASTITIECYYGDAPFDEIVNPDDLYKTLIILPGEENTLRLYGMGGFLPLEQGIDYLQVTNEKVKIFDDGGTDNSLLKEETYILSSESEYRRYYEYSFTDDYFKDGKPME